MPRAGSESALVLATLVVVAAAAGLEGAVVPTLGGPVVAAMALLGIWATGGGVERSSSLARAGFVLVALSVAWSALPVPEALRALVAPGQAGWIAQVAPEWRGDLDAWLAATARADLAAAVGGDAPVAGDPLAGAVAGVLRPGGIAPERAAWALAQLGGMLLAYRVGARLGRAGDAGRRFAVGLVLLAVVEALLGLAWRDGPTTGIGPKEYYLGSATGTFVNRGHFAAFLALGLAAAWGVAAGLFPLEDDEIRRHRKSRRRSSQPPTLWEAAGDRVPRLALGALAAGLIGVAMVASQSRGSLLGFGVAALALAGFAARVRGERFHIALGLGVPVAVAGLAVVGFGLRGAFGRFGELATGGGESVRSRLALWSEAVIAWGDAPVFGAGPGAWRLARGVHEVGPHLYDFRHAHAEWAEQLVELGFVGALGLTCLLVAWLVDCLRGYARAEHDERVAVGVGGLVGTVAVLIVSLGDFPLHTPGVGLATAVCAGLARGALVPAGERPPGARWPWMVLAGGTVALAAAAGWADAAVDATRAQRLGELPRAWFELAAVPVTPERADDRLAIATRAALATPLDPWAHALVAREEGRKAYWVAEEGGRSGVVVEHAYASDLAVARALRLRPADGRLLITLARTRLLVASAGEAPDLQRARAGDLLLTAIQLDPWRAEEAFTVADPLSDEVLARLAGAAPAEPGVHRARVLYAYGQALTRRGRTADALAAFAGARDADAEFGPPSFQIGVLLRAAGDSPGATRAFNKLLSAREKPPGMEGWALYYLGDYDAAEARFRRVVADAPNGRWAWEGLAAVGAARHDPRGELAAWLEIQRIAPDDARVAARVAELSTTSPPAPSAGGADRDGAPAPE